MKADPHEHPFYGVDIVRREQQEYIEGLMVRFQDQPVTDELKKAVWDLLMEEKYQGRITIPFKVFVKRDPKGLFRDIIEVLLDTKV